MTPRLFKIGRLYYRFIAGTPLESSGWTSEDLAQWLQQQGLIEVRLIQPTDKQGRFKSQIPMYLELAGMNVKKQALVNTIMRVYPQGLRARKNTGEK